MTRYLTGILIWASGGEICFMWYVSCARAWRRRKTSQKDFFLSRAGQSLIRFRVKPKEVGGDAEVW